MWPVAKRNNLYTVSLFASKLWFFRVKYTLRPNFSGRPQRLANARPLGRAKLANASPPGLKRRANAPKLPVRVKGEGHSWNWLMHNTVPCGRPLSISTNFVVLLNFENRLVKSRNVLIYIFSEIHRKTIISFITLVKACSNALFTITAEILARLLANFYCQ